MTKNYSFKPVFERVIPEGDDHERAVCTKCGFIDYQNPKIVVGSVAVWDNKILLCRRAIEPRRGFWTLPAGYLELGEDAETGARREALEEATARIEIDRLLAIYSVPRISQIQLIFRACLLSPEISAGPESEEVMLTEWADIPWPELAFPTASWALRHYDESKGARNFAPFSNPAEGL